MLEDRGALHKEEGDFIGEYKAMHKRNYHSRWLRDDTEGGAVKYEEMNWKSGEEESKSGRRELGEKKEMGAVVCDFPFCVSGRVFEK